jgi:hypothetical protein
MVVILSAGGPRGDEAAAYSPGAGP